MNESVSMEGLASSSDQTHGNHSAPPSSQSSAPDVVDSHTNGSGMSLNDSGPSTPAHDNFTKEPMKPETKGVFRPYAIEEPDDEPGSHIDNAELPRLPDYFEKWQRDLVDNVDDMGCEFDLSSGLGTSMSSKRGQKRKSGRRGSAPHHQNSQLGQSKSEYKPNGMPRSRPDLSPKRRRRRSRAPGDAAKIVHTASFHEFREAQRCGSSSSDPRSTDGSSPDSLNDSAVADEMDIDE